MLKTGQVKPRFKSYGMLIRAWRNEIKQSLSVVAKETGISLERLRAIEAGLVKPDWGELEKLALQFFVSVRDLLPFEDDLEKGIRFLKNQDARVTEQMRGGRLQYTYWSRVMTSALPSFKPVELLLHLTKKEDVILNRGHFFHQYTQVLHGGPVAFLWEWNGAIHEEIFEEGDSWMIPGFVPHGFYSSDAQRPGRILAITFGQHLTGDAREELRLLGNDQLSRIVEDDEDYYPQDKK